jgi:hypothetical protein
MRFLYISGIAFLLFNIQNYCMDKKELSLQQQIMLHLSDGKDFSIEKWKIFQSTALHKDYLRRQKRCDGEVKNMSLLYSNINSREIDLYSEVCDVDPGIPFQRYFKSLSLEDRRLLLTVAGRYAIVDQERQKKLNSSCLSAQLCDVCFDENFAKANIVPHMEQLPWLSYCRNTVVKDNLPYLFPDICSDVLCYRLTDYGYIERVKECLKSGSYDGPRTVCLIANDDKEFTTFLIKQLDSCFEYHLTAAAPENTDEKKNYSQRLLKLVNRDTNWNTSVLIQHEDDIWYSQFSPSGEYLCSLSDQMVLLSKIMRKEDNSLAVSHLSIPTSAPCQHIFFNKKSTAIILCCWDKDNNRGGLSLWDITNNDCVKKFEHDKNFITGICNDESDRLLTQSAEEDVGVLTLWNTTNLSNIYEIGKLRADKKDCFLMTVYAPGGNKWASITVAGKAIFAYEIDNKIVSLEECLDKFLITAENSTQTRIVYSPDECFVTIVYPHQNNCLMISLYSALNYEKLGTWPTSAQGVGFTSDSCQLIINLGDNVWGKIPLLNQNNCENLKDLAFNSSVHQLALLYRLDKAHRNKNTIELYKEESGYKALQLLSRTSQNIIQRSLPVPKVINNNKELIEISKEVLKRVEDQYDDTVKKIQDWWKKL